MKGMDLDKVNIDNLLGLWKLAGSRSGNFLSKDQYDLSYVADSEWPNRFWFTQNPSQDELKGILPQLLSDYNSITIPIWEDQLINQDPILNEFGFKCRSEQVAMYKELNGTTNTSSELNIEKVSDFRAALLWESLFSSAFGYKISSGIVMDTLDMVNYFIASINGIPVGTAVTFINDPKVIGIHSMGIIPEMRRRGYAEQILVELLNKSSKQGIKYCTLQASEAARKLYLKNGFKEQFTIKNFKLKN